MYNEEYDKRGFPFKDFLLRLILIIIFVFLLVWLLPKFIAPAINKNLGENNISISDKGLDALTSQIFQDNLEKMKEAAILYYTDERLPHEEGQSDKMTLSDMIGKKLITPLIDKNNKPVDVEESYVKITKMEDEYLLKVNLKDSEKEDYILVHLGCYNYCDGNLCEKKDEDVPIKGGNVPEIPKPQPKPDPDPETPQPDPIPIPDPDPEEPEKPVDPEEPEKPGDKEYLYEYAKTTEAKFSKWSLWSNWDKTSCNTKPVSCASSDIKCLSELKRLDRKEQIGTYEKEYVTTRPKKVQVASYDEKSCALWEYVIINEKTYAVTRTYSKIVTVTPGRPGSIPGWNYGGRKPYKNPPRNENGKYYVFVGADYSYCGSSCTTLPDFIYDEYTYTGSMIEVDSTTKPVSESTTVEAKCGEIVTKTIPVFRTINVSEIATRQEPLYGTVCYKSERERTLLEAGKTEKRWSVYNDKSLLDNGWYYTGEVKVK